MTGLEILIAVIATIWVLKNAAVDTAFAVRGKASPRLARRLGASGGRRYGAGAYMSDLWSDTWRGMRERREARAAGITPPPRPQGWLGRTYGRLRGRITSWWDGATTRVDNRRQAELIQGQERLHTSRWQRFKDRMLGRDVQAWPAVQRRPGEDFAGRPKGNGGEAQPPQPEKDKPAPQASDGDKKPTEPEPDEDGEKPANGHAPVELNGAPVRTPIGDPAERSGATDHPRAQGEGEDNTNQEENDMAEVTGLATAINYAGAQQQANEAAVSQWEQFLASLQAGEVSGEPIAAAQRAMEAHQVAATAAAEAQDALLRHQQVKEAYDANQDAGSKQFVTSE